MKPITTLNELAVRLLGEKVNDALESIDVCVIDDSSRTDPISPTDLAQQYLSPEVNESIKSIDVKKEAFVVHFMVRDFQGHVRIRGLSTLIALLVLASLILDQNRLNGLIQMIHHLLGGL